VLDPWLACQAIDRPRAVIDGRAAIEGCRLNVVTARPEEIFQRAFRHQEFDISELSLATHLVTTGRGDGPYVAIPAFVSRAFRHSSIYVRTGAGIDRPQDLNGRNVGVPDFQPTAGVSARGLPADGYGVDRRDSRWFMGGLDQPGRAARVPLRPNGKIRIDMIAADRTLSQMLDEGELDAVIAPRPPKGYGGNGVA